MTTNELEQQAYEITKKLESYERFSPEWYTYLREVVIPWTEKHQRPLYRVYSED